MKKHLTAFGQWMYLKENSLSCKGNVWNGDIAGQLFKEGDKIAGASVVQVKQGHGYYELFRMNFFEKDFLPDGKFYSYVQEFDLTKNTAFLFACCQTMQRIVEEYLAAHPMIRYTPEDTERCNVLTEKCLRMLGLLTECE